MNLKEQFFIQVTYQAMFNYLQFENGSVSVNLSSSINNQKIVFTNNYCDKNKGLKYQIIWLDGAWYIQLINKLNEVLINEKFYDYLQNDEEIISCISGLIETKLSIFESNLDKNTINIKEEENIEDKFYEGEEYQTISNKYERNKAAREACIKYYGCTCQICGFDFGKVYGNSFKNLIEVHHIKPIHEIKEEYEVDPINDLIPVCSNCHFVLHSQGNDKVYTVEEVKEMIKIKDKNDNFKNHI